MGDRRSSTIPTPSEEQKLIKKKAEAMLAKSENNWNKVTAEQKEVLNSPTSAHFFFITRSQLEQHQLSLEGYGVTELDQSIIAIEFIKGKLFVNAADPSNLSWTLIKKGDRSKTDVKKVKLLKLSQNFTGVKDLLEKEHKKIGTIGSSPCSITSYEDPYDIYDHNGSESQYFICEGADAEEVLNSISHPDEKIDSNCLILLSTDEGLLFVLFRTQKQAVEWSIALKILLKAQNLSYRGTKDEYPTKKKDFSKEIMKDKDIRLEFKDKNILFWVSDLEVDSFLYRELKIYLWNRGGEKVVFCVVDMRKPVMEQLKSFEYLIKNETYLFKLLFMAYLSDLEVARYFLIMQEHYDVGVEIKQAYFKDQKDSLLTLDHTGFWYARRKLRKRYQALVLKESWVEKKKKEEEKADDEETTKRKKKKRGAHKNPKPSVNDRFDIDCTEISKIFDRVRSSLILPDAQEESTNEVLNMLKILQLQKQAIRSKLVRISTIRSEKNPIRRSKGGRAMKNKALKTTEKVAKKAYTAASNVLKIMMFEDTLPGLIPEQIRHTISLDEKKRDGCCSIY